MPPAGRSMLNALATSDGCQDLNGTRPFKVYHEFATVDVTSVEDLQPFVDDGFMSSVEERFRRFMKK